jgi:hypothetical protein
VKICSNIPIFATDRNVNSIIKNLFIMKKRLFLLAMCLISVVYSYSQTSEQDYNYLKKGYVLAKTMGYPLRKDVKLVELSTAENEQAEYTIFSLNDSLDTKTLCIGLLIKNKTTKKNSWIVVPSNKSDKELISEFHKEIDLLQSTEKYYISIMLYQLTKF